MDILDNSFWDQHWDEIALPQTINYNLKLEKSLAVIFKKCLPDGRNNNTVFEIGCAPGKWLVFFAKEMNYNVTGIDFSQKGVKHTLANFQMNDVSGKVINGDINNFNSNRKYDIVFSLGFIEHFDNVDDIIKTHVDILEKDGWLILGIPNFKGVNYFIQKIIDKKVIADHNLSIMNISYLKNLGDKFNLNPVILKYVGGFAPTMFGHRAKNNIRKLYNKNSFFNWFLNLVLKLNILSFFNSRFFSSYIIAVYKKS